MNHLQTLPDGIVSELAHLMANRIEVILTDKVIILQLRAGYNLGFSALPNLKKEYEIGRCAMKRYIYIR